MRRTTSVMWVALPLLLAGSDLWAANPAGRWAVGAEVSAGLLHGDLQNRPAFGGIGGDLVSFRAIGRYGLTSNLGVVMGVGGTRYSGENDHAAFRPIQDDARFRRTALDLELAAQLFLAPDSRVSPHFTFGGGLHRVVGAEETGDLFHGLRSGDNFGTLRFGVGTDIDLDRESRWALSVETTYALASSDRMDGIAAGGFGDGGAGLRVGIWRLFGRPRPSIYAATPAPPVDEVALLDRVDARILEARREIDARLAEQFDRLREELSRKTRDGGGITFQTAVRFASGSAELDDAARSTLERIAETMREHPASKALLTGYADARSTHLYNLNLSQERAEAVRAFLVARGVDLPRLQVLGLGERGPDGSAPESVLAANRRVEIFVWEGTEPPPTRRDDERSPSSLLRRRECDLDRVAFCLRCWC